MTDLKHCGGIREPEDLRQRCYIAPADDCWHWRGIVDKNGLAKIWFAEFGATTTIGPVIGFFRTSKRPTKAIWIRSCNSPDCVNPNHWHASNRSAAVRRYPRANPALHKINSTKASRARSKIDQAIAEIIRSSGDSGVALALKYGLSESAISRIILGKAWVPLKLPANSIFALGATL